MQGLQSSLWWVVSGEMKFGTDVLTGSKMSFDLLYI